MLPSTLVAARDHSAVSCTMAEPQTDGTLGYVTVLRTIRIPLDDGVEQMFDITQCTDRRASLSEVYQEQLISEGVVLDGLGSAIHRKNRFHIKANLL